MKTTECYPQVGDDHTAPTTTTPQYDEWCSNNFKQVATQNVLETEQNCAANHNLTSVFEEEEEGIFDGVRLFYFLINSAFYALLPFLSILIFRNGFSASQIGVFYTAVFLVSIFSSTIWNALLVGKNKHVFMLVSIGSWIVGYFPLIWIKRDPVGDECVFLPPNKTIQASQNLSQVYNFGVRQFHNSTTNFYERWTGFFDHQFLLFLGVLCLGRIFQSSTDYFYFDHKRLLYLQPIAKKLSSKPSFYVSTKISAAIITIFIGHLLDSILYCNLRLGHFQILFYLFLVFAASSLFVLYFLEMDYSQLSDYQQCYIKVGEQEESIQHLNRTSNSLFLKIVLSCGMVVSGATRSFHYTFLQLKLSSVNALYVQIGLAFAIHIIVRSCVKLFARNFKQVSSRLGITETLVIITSVDSIRNLFFSYITKDDNLFLWLVIPIELLSGFSSLLDNNSNTKTLHTVENNEIVSERLFFVCYWCIGYTFGPIVLGFGYDVWSISYIFRCVALVNIGFAMLLAVSSFACTSSSIPSNDISNESIRTIDYNAVNAFLITNNDDDE